MKTFFSYFLSLLLVILLSLGSSFVFPSVSAESSSALQLQYNELRALFRNNETSRSQKNQLRKQLLSLRREIRETKQKELEQKKTVSRRRLQIIPLRKRSLSESQMTLRPIRLPVSSSSQKTGSLSDTPGSVLSAEEGKASYYADTFNGRTTASGEIFSNSALTAAHKTLPFGTRVRVINVSNGNQVEVIINDRGPYSAGRIIDLSSAAFSALDNLSRGVLDVRVEILSE